MDGTRSGKTKVTSISLQAETLEAVRAIAGKQGVSAFIEEAVQQELHRRGLQELLDAMIAANGPVDEEDLRQKLERSERFHATHRSRPGEAA